MNFEEINKYILFGSTNSICIYRDRVNEELDEIVKSVSISSGNNQNLFELLIEFDPIIMIGEDEGWQWRSTGMTFDVLVGVLEKYLNQSLYEWENINKSGKLENYNDEIFDTEDIQGTLFEDKYDFGFELLPELPVDVSWWIRPYKYNKMHGLLEDYDD